MHMYGWSVKFKKMENIWLEVRTLMEEPVFRLRSI